MKQVVVAEKPRMTVIGHKDIISRFGPQDIVANLHVGGTPFDPHVVPRGGVEGVLDHPHIAHARCVEPCFQVAVDQVVNHPLAPSGQDSLPVVTDPVIPDGAFKAADPRIVSFYDVGLIQAFPSQHARSRDTRGVLEHVLVLHPCGLEFHARGVVVDLVGTGGAVEPQGVRSSRNGGAQAPQGGAVDPVLPHLAVKG